MKRSPYTFEIEEGETDDISITGARRRKPTVLIRLGKYSLSKRAFQLGALLLLCQILDGVLTYTGLSMLGLDMEGNEFLRTLMHTYGTAPALLLVKLLAICFVFVLMIQAHSRRWVRPVIAVLIVIYLAAAVLPWIYIISAERARGSDAVLREINRD
jgi:uncharacterized membrane protein